MTYVPLPTSRFVRIKTRRTVKKGVVLLGFKNGLKIMVPPRTNNARISTQIFRLIRIFYVSQT